MISQDVARVCRPSVLNLVESDAGKTFEEGRRGLGQQDIVKLSSNESSLGPSPRVLEAIRSTLPRIAMYPEKSFFHLKNALARANGVSAENISVGHGSETFIQLIPQLFVNPGVEVVLAAMTYGRYEEASKLMDGCVVSIPPRDLRLDLKAMAAAVTDRTRIVCICKPNNPTGTFVRRGEVAVFPEAVPPTVAVVFDQAYFEYVDDPGYADDLDFPKGWPRQRYRFAHLLESAWPCRAATRIWHRAGSRPAAPRHHQGAVQSQSALAGRWALPPSPMKDGWPTAPTRTAAGGTFL